MRQCPFNDDFIQVICILVYILVHTSYPVLVHTFESNVVHNPVYVSLLWMFPSHLFPAHFPFPFSLSKAVTGARFLGNSSTLRYWRYFPSHFSLPTFSYTFSLLRLFPCPLFPTLVPCQKQSVAPDSPESPPLLSLCVSFPSFSLPTVPFPLSLFSIMSLPSFTIFDYVPALFPYFRLFPWQPFVPDDLMLLIQIVTRKIYVWSV